jgi:hypothetical protein
LEASGLPTVVFGCARDIVERCGVPRFVFADFPLGNPCGKPYEPDMQRAIVEMGLDLLAGATAPRPTFAVPFAWGGDTWKEKAFTKEQPFLDGEDRDTWLRRNEEYRRLKAAGKV